MSKHLIEYPLVSVGETRIVILSDRPHKGPDPYSLDNTPGIIKGQTNEGVPFMYFVEKSRDDMTASVVQAVSNLASLINIRKELRKGTAVDNSLGWERHTAYNKLLQGFFQFVNSSFTESVRKQLYKAVMSNESLLNLDGVIFKLIRKNGIITLSVNEYPRKSLHFWQGVVDGYGLHSSKDWVKHTLGKNLDKYENISSADWCTWPKELEPTHLNYYTGYRTKPTKEIQTNG